MNAFGISDKGAVRSENQDCFRLNLPDGRDTAVLVLCDGMGGARGGSLASQIAAEAFVAHALDCLAELPPMEVADIMPEAASYANIKVFDRAYTDETCKGMGTTLVGLIVREEEAFLCNVGDSRGYLYSGGRLEQVTRDHSLVEDLVRRGAITREEARTHPRKNVITRAVGLEARVKCDIFRPTLQPEDIILLCSDGLSNVLTDPEIESFLAQEDNLEAACGRLIQSALERGAPDNVTAVLFRR